MKFSKKAFGLVETLIACAILIVIIGAIVALNIIITNNIAFTKQRATAFNLAQEGIESVRQIRDSNLVDGAETNWNTFICDNSNSGGLSAPDLSLDPQPTYKVSAGQFLFCYMDGEKRITLEAVDPKGEAIKLEQMNFYRKITFEQSGVNPEINDTQTTADNAIRVVVTVSWNMNGRDSEVVVKELLTNWKPGL